MGDREWQKAKVLSSISEFLVFGGFERSLAAAMDQICTVLSNKVITSTPTGKFYWTR